MPEDEKDIIMNTAVDLVFSILHGGRCFNGEWRHNIRKNGM